MRQTNSAGEARVRTINFPSNNQRLKMIASAIILLLSQQCYVNAADNTVYGGIPTSQSVPYPTTAAGYANVRLSHLVPFTVPEIPQQKQQLHK